MKKVLYREIEGSSNGYLALLGVLGAIIAIGLFAVWNMEHEGHWITGMTNQIVWGTPHVFAVFLIVAASGALNVASIASVFKKDFYKPMARLSALLAIALLAGGLVILVLDLGQPDRLLVAMTYYNFKSIFAWNVILYNGFFVVVGLYLWFMLDRRLAKHSSKIGIAAFIWRLILTTGTGSIFGFLVARQAYDAAIMAPMFIVMSFAFGLAIFILVLMASYKWTGRELGDVVINRLKNLLGVFIAAVVYFEAARHLTNLYATEHHGVQAFLLAGDNIYTYLFWVVQLGLGAALPLLLIYCPRPSKSRVAIAIASVLVIIGGLAQMYVIIIGGQAYPLVLFPGYEVSSSFYDGTINQYSPSLYEVLLGLGGVAFALALVVVAVKVLNLLPESLSDAQFAEEKG
ncbi:MAG: NrfD/PsrC family molybdoenzyme membrane anchor subunit [Gammaproteobacteria bacterium]